MKLEISPNPQTKAPFNPGKKVFEWDALDYHPHKRGVIWFTLFGLVFFGIPVWSLVNDPRGGWITAFTFLAVAAFYFWTHRNAESMQKIQVFENGIFVGQKFFPIDQFSGYWFVYDQTVSVLNLQLRANESSKLSLQMGTGDPDFFRQMFSQTTLVEITGKKESLLDLWIRALKL